MKRALLIAAAASLALAGTAAAKGPSEAKITGAGLAKPIMIRGNGEMAGTQLAALTDEAGFFPAVFGQSPDPMLQGRPKGQLGRKLMITYRVPGPYGRVFVLHQDVYPWAKDGPFTYMRPGQEIFSGQKTRGGWFQAPYGLKQLLVKKGVSARQPAARSSGYGSGLSIWQAVLIAVGGGLLLVGAGTVVARRRRHGA
jgi:hypothetical protein